MCCRKENADVRAARIKRQVDRLRLNASPARTDGKWVPAEGASSIKTFRQKENSAERPARPG